MTEQTNAMLRKAQKGCMTLLAYAAITMGVFLGVGGVVGGGLLLFENERSVASLQ